MANPSPIVTEFRPLLPTLSPIQRTIGVRWAVLNHVLQRRGFSASCVVLDTGRKYRCQSLKAIDLGIRDSMIFSVVKCKPRYCYFKSHLALCRNIKLVRSYNQPHTHLSHRDPRAREGEAENSCFSVLASYWPSEGPAVDIDPLGVC
jgi:hypothetical protein